MNYLIYVERSAENLQFFLWLRDYERRFAAADTADLALAPEWTRAMEDEAVARIRKTQAEKVRKMSNPAVDIFKGTDFEKGNNGRKGSVATDTDISEFVTSLTPVPLWDTDLTKNPPHSTGLRQARHSRWREQRHLVSPSPCCLQPPKTNPPPLVTIQPFRKEIDRVIATYIADGAPRQLNLSDYEQKGVLHALSFTTHPSAFRLIARQTEATLRQQAHPNFIRWSICNGNPARVFFARGLGVATILLGVAAGVVLTLSRAPRGYRALAAIALVIGFATLMAAYKGMVWPFPFSLLSYLHDLNKR